MTWPSRERGILLTHYALCIIPLLLVAYTVADGHNATRRREYCRVLCLSYTALVDYGDWGVVTCCGIYKNKRVREKGSVRQRS